VNGIPLSDVSVDLNTILLHQRHYFGRAIIEL